MALKARKRRAAGDFWSLKRLLWSGILEAVRIVEAADTPEDRRLKAISCLSTACGVYANLLHAHDVESRLAALEAAEKENA